MAPRRTHKAQIAVRASLVGVVASAGVLAGGYAGALASGRSSSSSGAPPVASAPRASRPNASLLGLTLPSVTVSVPSVTVSVPGVSVSTPTVSASTPTVSASGGGVSASGAGVSASGGGASGAGVTVSVPSTTVSVPSVGVSTPTSGSGKGESSGAGNPPSGGSGGGGEGSPPPSSPGGGSHSGGGSGSAAGPRAGSASLLYATSNLAGAAAGVNTPGVVGGNTATSHSQPTGVGRRGSSEGTRVAGGGGGASAGGLAGGAGGLLAAGATHARSAGAEHHASNALESIGGQIPLPLPVPDWSKPIILALLVLALWFALRSRTAARRARRLERQRATLLRDVGVMQAALVPEIPARVGGLAVSVAYRPAEGPAAGGDFYDVFVPERGKVAIILGDVAGHGHEALTQAALTRYTLRAYLQAGMQPRAALALAGQVLADPSTEHFATVTLGVYDARDGRLMYASAGHPPPILHGLQTREPLTLCASPPLGWTVPTGRRQTIVSLPPGAVACFYSDGLIEARCESGLLGRARLSELLDTLGTRPNASKLLARVSSAALATPDDMAACIVAPEVSVIGARVHIEELEADGKALSGPRVRRFLQTCVVPAADIDQALARASAVAHSFGTALLRVELAARTATVSVSKPQPVAQANAEFRQSRPAGEPSGAR